MNGNQVIEIGLDKILPNRFQPRIKFHEKNINELAESIREHGVIQPIVVRKISDKYEIIAGERRYKASVIANKKSIPALVVNLNDKDAAEVALIENVQRQDLTPIEEAVSYKKILDMGMTQEQLAQKLGKTQSTVANKLRLLNLDEEVQEALLEQKISERHARSLLKLTDLKDQTEILNKIITERLTVRKTDQVIKDYLANKNLENVKNKMNDIEDNNKGENIMNYENNNMNFENNNINYSNNNNNFNIPITPIEGDLNQPSFNQTNENIQDIPVVQPIPDFSVPVSENNTNPGFMDVNKIENQAQDIFVETPKADVDNLLTEDQKMVEINNQYGVNNTTEEDSDNSGKFFNFMPNNNQENFVSDLEKKETNMDFIPQEETTQPQFNFDAFFNNNYVDTTPSQPINQNVENNNESNPSYNSMGLNSNNDSIMNQVEPEISNVQNNAVDSEINNNFSGFTFEEPVLQPIQNSSTSSTVEQVESNGFPQFDQNLNYVESPNVMENVNVTSNLSEPVEQTPQDLGFNMDFRNLTPNSEPTVHENSTIPQFNVQEPINNMNDMAMPNSIFNNVVQPVVENSIPTIDFKEAVNTLKACCSELQSKGFNISMDEYDLENMFQIVFRIQK